MSMFPRRIAVYASLLSTAMLLGSCARREPSPDLMHRQNLRAYPAGEAHLLPGAFAGSQSSADENSIAPLLAYTNSDLLSIRPAAWIFNPAYGDALAGSPDAESAEDALPGPATHDALDLSMPLETISQAILATRHNLPGIGLSPGALPFFPVDLGASSPSPVSVVQRTITLVPHGAPFPSISADTAPSAFVTVAGTLATMSELTSMTPSTDESTAAPDPVYTIEWSIAGSPRKWRHQADLGTLRSEAHWSSLERHLSRIATREQTALLAALHDHGPVSAGMWLEIVAGEDGRRRVLAEGSVIPESAMGGLQLRLYLEEDGYVYVIRKKVDGRSSVLHAGPFPGNPTEAATLDIEPLPPGASGIDSFLMFAVREADSDLDDAVRRFVSALNADRDRGNVELARRGLALAPLHRAMTAIRESEPGSGQFVPVYTGTNGATAIVLNLRARSGISGTP